MSLRFSCACGKALQVAVEHAGRQVRCPECGEVQRAPADASSVQENVLAASVSAPPRVPSSEETIQEASRVPPPLPRSVPPPLPAARDDDDEEADGPPLEDLALVNHAGEPVDEEDDFFVPAPTEIGRVVSAHTTLKTYKEPWSWPARLAFLLPVLVGSLVLLVVLVIHKPALSWLVLPLLGGWTLFVLVLTRFSHTVNYVGTQGLAVFKCGAHRRRITHTEIFLFQDAIDLRTEQTNMYVNGVYSGTSYCFRWTDEEDRKAFQLNGQYWSRQDLPPAKNPFRFALAAEGAWTGYLADNMDSLLVDKRGLLLFPLKKEDWVRIGTGLLRLRLGGKEVELESEQIEKILMGDGIISIFQVGGKEGWFTSSGVYKIVYKDLANARFFLFALHKLVGFKLY